MSNVKRQQQYKIVLQRLSDGRWCLRGYWEIMRQHTEVREDRWDSDGEPLYFSTRKEAMESLAKVTGIPD